LLLKTSSNNSICALVVPGWVPLFNLQTYASTKEDGELYGEKMWIPPPAILHTLCTFDRQAQLPGPAKTTVYSFLMLACWYLPI
jgi:hypothetical protein